MLPPGDHATPSSWALLRNADISPRQLIQYSIILRLSDPPSRVLQVKVLLRLMQHSGQHFVGVVVLESGTRVIPGAGDHLNIDDLRLGCNTLHILSLSSHNVSEPPIIL